MQMGRLFILRVAKELEGEARGQESSSVMDR